jgi:flagellar hook protein FlgE
MSFRIALTGLDASSTSLDVIANNIANTNTTGFKDSTAHFAELVAGMGSGNGVQVADVKQSFLQGSLTTTDSPLDMGVSGNGFFRLSDQGSLVYSRAGNFTLDRDAYIVTSAGHRLTGYLGDGQGSITGAIGEIQLPAADLPPRATTASDIAVNLDAASTQPPVTPFDYTDPNTYNYTTALSVYDTQGGAHTLTAYFAKQGVANAWDVHYSVDGTSPTHVTPLTGNLAFTTSGALDTTATPQPTTIDIDLAGVATELGQQNGSAVPLSIQMSYAPTTQYGSPSSTNAINQDGFATGRLASIDVDQTGVIYGRYTNGQGQALAQVALANFAAPEALANLGDTVWGESFGSGAALVGTPASGSLGVVEAGALEESNVDLAHELVNMITAQRAYQANAQVISTADTLFQTIINI